MSEKERKILFKNSFCLSVCIWITYIRIHLFYYFIDFKFFYTFGHSLSFSEKINLTNARDKIEKKWHEKTKRSF